MEARSMHRNQFSLGWSVALVLTPFYARDECPRSSDGNKRYHG